MLLAIKTFSSGSVNNRPLVPRKSFSEQNLRILRALKPLRSGNISRSSSLTSLKVFLSIKTRLLIKSIKSNNPAMTKPPTPDYEHSA